MSTAATAARELGTDGTRGALPRGARSSRGTSPQPENVDSHVALPQLERVWSRPPASEPEHVQPQLERAHPALSVPEAMPQLERPQLDRV